MKNLLNLGKALNKAEQKEVFGGIGDGTERDPCDPGSETGSGVYMSASCRCWASGGTWNAECGRCDTSPYFAAPDCRQIFP